MIGINITNNVIATSKGHFRTIAPWFDWLLEQVGDEPAMFYHLDANVASLLKLINFTETEGRKLLDNKKLYLAPYRITYYPSKFFSIALGFSKGNPYARFYNAGQYLTTHFEPDDDIIETAISKAKQAKEIGEQVVKALHKMGLDTNKLVSPISALDNRLTELKLPTIDDIPSEAGEFAYGCVKGNWLEAFACGYWK